MARFALGEKFYVFSDQDDQYFGHNPKLIISANGVANGAPFQLEDWIDKVAFYYVGGVPDDARLRVFATGRPPHAQAEYKGGQFCPDYALSKFQSQKGENYDDIDWNVENLIAHSRQVADLRCDNDPLANAWTEPFDVLTVRHRLLMRSPTLSEAIQACKEVRRDYRSIHCMFF